MLSTKTVLALFTTLAAIADVAHAGIQECPSISYTVTGNQGNYAVCHGADFRGTTLDQIPSVASIQDCVTICDGAINTYGYECIRVSYNSWEETCHLKDSVDVEWVEDSNYDTAVLHN